jgi:uncharacterized protein YbjT (DUF2867 family)
MKVFITGATGFVGNEIVRQLRDAGYAVRILVRNQPSVFGEGREIRVGNILDPQSLKRGLEGTDAVIHLVGIISEIGANTFENIHVQGTRNVVAAAHEQGVKRFIHMSALGTRANAASRYHQTKWQAEEILRGGGFDFTIFRPSLIFGPRDMFVNMFAKMIRFSPVVPILGRRDARFQPVAVETVACAFVKSLREEKAIGQTFDLAGSETFTMSQIVDQILGAMNRKRLKLPIPSTLAQIQAACLEFFFSKILHKAAPLNRDQLMMLREDNTGNPEPANKLFGLKPIPFRGGIEKYLGDC